MNLRYVLLIVVFLRMGEAFGQETFSLTLDRAIELGLENSKQLTASRAKMEQAAARLQQAKEARLPDLKISGSYLQLNHPDISFKTSGNGSSPEMAHPSTAIYGMATLNLPLYSGSRIKYGIEAARLLNEAAKFDAGYDKDKIVLNIINAYTNLYKAQASVNLVKENLNSSKQRDKDLINLEKNGLLARNDLLKAQLQTSNIELALVNAENGLRISTIALDLITGLPESTVLKIDSASLAVNNDVLAVESYVQQALEKRKDIMAIEMRRGAAAATLKQTRGEYIPSIGLTGGYVAADIPKVLTVTNALNAGVGIQYNLGSLWKTKGKIREAQAAEKEIMATEAIIADNVKLEVNQAYQDYLSARKKIEVQEAAILNAKENLRITKNKFENNLVSTTELLDANTSMLESEINLAMAKADLFLAYNTLLQQSGIINKK